MRLVRAGVGEATLIGFAGSPFTVACYMVEGQGTKEFAHVRRMAYSQPGLFAQLMDTVTDATIEYLSAQIDAGAEVVMLFDSWAGVLSPRLFHKHVIMPTKRIVDAMAQRHPGIQVIGFPRGAGTLLAAYAAETGVSAVAIDTGVDPAFAIAAVPGQRRCKGISTRWRWSRAVRRWRARRAASSMPCGAGPSSSIWATELCPRHHLTTLRC